MAKPQTLTFGNFLVYLGDGTTPVEVFSTPCGFTDRSLEIKASTADTDVPDCDDEDAPAWTERGVKALSASVSGQGVLALESSDVWRNWALSGLSKNVRVAINKPLAQNGGYFQGAAVLTSYKLDGSYGDKVKSTVAIDSDGQWTWVPAVA